MAGPNEKLQLEILVLNKQANVAIAQTNDVLSGFEKNALQWSTRVSGGMDSMTRSMTRGVGQTRDQIEKARDSADLLGNMIGVQLPREVRKFVAETKILGTILSSVFKFSIYLAAGEALISWVVRIGEKLGWWGDQANATKKQNDELTKSIKEQDKALKDYVSSMQSISESRRMIGLSGSARGQQEVVNAKRRVDEARIELSGLGGQLNRAILDARDYRIVGGKMERTEKAIAADASYAAIQAEQVKAEETYILAKENLINVTRELANTQSEEIAKTKQYIDANQARVLKSLRGAQAGIAGLAAPGGISISEGALAGSVALARGQSDAPDEAFVKEWRDKRIEAVQSLSRENENMVLAQLRKSKDYQGALAIELRQLEALKEQYTDNADAIEAIEERKKLAIMDTNRQISDDAQTQFDRSATAIEGFFNRVFMTARSFGDVVHQLLGQLANYAVSAFSKIAAAALGGRSSGGGILGSLGGLLGGGGGIGPGGTAPFLASPTGGTGGILNKALGGLGLSGLLGGGGAAASAAASSAAFGTGGMMAGMSGISTSAAAGAGSGGLLGSMGAFFTNPWTIGIGAAALGVFAIFKLFHRGETPEEKMRKKVKSAYSVDIKDKGVLKQLVGLAQQGFGGDFDRTIRSAQAQDMIQQYAEMTGQTTRGIRGVMTGSTLVQSGGGLYQANYSNGMSVASTGGLPGMSLDSISGSGSTSGGPMVINISVPGAKDFFKNETVQVIVNNPKAVQAASVQATKSSSNRRELSALQWAPGTLTS